MRALRISFHAASLPAATSIDSAIEDAAAASFDAVDFGIGAKAELNYQSTESDCRRIRSSTDKQQVAISALWMRDFELMRLAVPPGEDRRAVHHDVSCALERAAWLGAEAVVIGRTGSENAEMSPTAPPSYEDFFFQIAESLSELRFTAERHAVTLACLAPADRFLPSPLEARRFIDEINSPWVAICLDGSTAALQCCWPDWLAALGHRLERIYLPGAALTQPDSERRLLIRQAVLSTARSPRTVSCRKKQCGLDVQAWLEPLLGAPAN